MERVIIYLEGGYSTYRGVLPVPPDPSMGPAIVITRFAGITSVSLRVPGGHSGIAAVLLHDEVVYVDTRILRAIKRILQNRASVRLDWKVGNRV